MVFELPPSFAQERLWFIDRLVPGSPAYNIPLAIELAGPFDRRAWARAVAEIRRRHEALRTTFAETGDGLVQLITPPEDGAPPLPEIDLRGLPEALRHAETARVVAAEARRPFDLVRGPLFRASLVAAGEERAVALATVHHIVADGWSLALILQDLSALYNAWAGDRAGRPSPLPELPLQYGDFALWQREWLTEEVLAEPLAHFRAALAGAPPVLALPADRPRPPVASFRGRHAALHLPDGLVARLGRVGRESGATLFMTLLAGLAALLHRISGAAVVPIGLPVAGRPRTELEMIVGLFVNTVVVAPRTAPAEPFRALLAHTRQAALDAYAREHLPFERLVEEMKAGSSLSENPICQVLFAFHVEATAAPRFAGLESDLLDFDLGASRVDLSFAAEPAEEGGLTAGLELATDLFDLTTGTRLLGAWRELLTGAAAAPESRLDDLPLLTSPERHQLLAEWSGGAPEPPTDVLARWTARVRRAPEALAVARWRAGALAQEASAAAADRRAARLARRLRAAGAGSEARVGICLPRSPALLPAILGVWKAGAAYLPLDPALPDARLAFLLADGTGGIAGGSRLVVTSGDLAPRLTALGVPDLQAIEFDDDSADHADTVSREIDEAYAVEGDCDGEAAAGTLAYLIYTSGTTGAPKAVAVERRSLAHTLAAVAPWFSAGDRMPCLAPFSFDIFLFELLAPVLAGGAAVLFDLQPTLDVAALAAALPAMTQLHAVPALARQIAAAARRGESAIALHRIYVGGDAVPGDLAAELQGAFPGARVTILYGPTEGTILAAAGEPDSHSDAGPAERRLIGRPLPGVCLRLADAAGRPVPIGVPGEILLGGPGVARGYLGRPELTAERFVPGDGGESFTRGRSGVEPAARLYRTGDLARLLADGRIEFLGRADRQLKVRGFRIEPAEVEAALASHPAVALAVVDLAVDLAPGARLAAWVVLRPGGAATPIDLAEHLRARLPAYMVPGEWTAVAALPLTAHGKVDRAALPRAAALPWPGAGRGAHPLAPYAPPRTPLEERLAAIWAELLGRERAGVHDDFFAAGGHSLLATQALSRLRDALGVELPVAALFEAPTPAGLSALIEGEAAAGPAAPSILPLPRTAAPLEAPLSFAQERLWLLDQLHPGATYNLPFSIDLAGPLDAAAWAAAVAAVRRRHEALRTRFRAARPGEEMEGAAVQVVEPPEAPWPGTALVDLSALPPPQRAAEAARAAAAEARRPFDLAAGPLLRSALLRLGECEHRALLSFHHVVSDGWSTEVLLRELGELYGGGALPPLRVQYADYALWQRRWLSGDVLARQLSWWRGQLAGDLVLELPGDRPRPPREAHGELAGRELPAAVPAPLARGLSELGRAAGATPFMTLLAALAALFHRVTGVTGSVGGGGAEGRDRIAVGAPIANRNRAEIEGLIGFFVNSLVLVADLSGEPTFAALLERVRETALGAYAHQDLPFEKLVAELRPERRLDGNPLFRVALSWNRPLPRLAALGAPISGVARETPTGTAKFDLALALTNDGDGLSGVWEYRTDLFDRATVARFADAFGHLLADAVAHPERPVARLDLLGEAARHQLLREWNDTAADVPVTTLADGFARQVARTPEAPALLGPAPGAAMSYGELDRRAAALARRLVALGVGPETRVALLLRRSTDLVVAILATLKAGGAYVPLDPNHPAERLAFLLADSQAAVVVTHRGLAARLGGTELPVLDLDALDDRMAADGGPGAPPPILPDNLAYVIYTSGSTGRPKGVAATHRNVLRLVHNSGFAAFGPEETFLLLAPASFDASTLEIWGPLLHGGRLAIAPDGRTSLAEIAALIRTHGVTTLWLTTGLFHQMVDEELPALAPLRQLLTGGDIMSPPRVRAVVSRLPGTFLVHAYGPTEGTTFTTCGHLDPAALPAGTGGTVPVGRPIGNARVHVVDAHLEPLPAGVPGELAIGGDGLARGYLGRPELTAERFVPDPFSELPGGRLYRTGDRIRCLPDGRLDFIGRTDLQVKVAGQRIEPGEVEAALAGHPRVRAAAVAVVGEGAEGKRLLAFAVPDEGAAGRAPEGPELRAWLAARLPEAMVPSHVQLVPRLPLTLNGKVDRAALGRLAAEAARGGLEERRGEAAPSPIVEILLGLWADLLGREQVGLHDSFFELGGHSLLGSRLIARVRHVLGREVSLRALFEEPTVAGLAARIERGREEGGEDLPPLVPHARPASRETPAVPASLTQRRLWFLQQLAPEGFFLNVPHAVRLAGDLAVPALARALSALVARHAPLRSAFFTEAGEPMVRTAPPAPLALPLVDLSALRGARREAAARDAVERASARRFDLARPPLVRALLLRLAPADHVLSIVPHHLVFDGWSVGVLFRELGELYGAFALGRPSPLAPLPIAYADYAGWQRQVLAGPLGARQLAYWRERLAGLPALDLIPDRPRPPVPSFRGGFATVRLPTPLASGLAALGRRQGATLFMLVLAFWELVLARLSGQRDFPVGAPVAGRTRPEVEDLVGFFVNTLVLRADLEGEPRLPELLARARETVLGAYANQDLPFEELVSALKPERNVATNPLFDVVLSFEETGAPPELPGLAAEAFPFAYDAAHFELMLAATRPAAGRPGAGELALTLNYRRELFDETTARRHLEHLLALVAAAVADPEAPAFDLPFWEEGARHQAIREWREEGWTAPPLPTADRLALEAARRAPDALAVAGPAGALSYGGLAAAAAAIGSHLRRLGVGRGARVALVLDRSPELAAASLATLALGAAAVPVDPAVPDARLAEIAGDSGALSVVAGPAALARLRRAGIAAAIGERGIDVEAACRAALRAPASQLAARAAAAHGPADLAYVIYTSGSTGRPKGVELVHDGLADLLAWHAEVYGPTTRGSWTANPGFDAAMWELWSCLASGGSLHVPPREIARSPRELLAWMAAEGISFAFLTTPLAEAVVRLPPPPGLALGWIATGGDRLQKAPVPEAGYTLVNHYGPTETTVVSTFEPVPAATGQAPAPPIGRPMGGAEVYVLDRDLAPVPIGGRGEICLAGRCLARGYLGRPEATAERFVPHPFAGPARAGARLYRSGDLGRLLPDGRLEFLGRADRQVKVRGFRVEPGEIEAHLTAHPAVADAAIAVESTPTGARLVACIVARDGANPDAEALRAHLRAALPDYMVPALFAGVDALPFSPNGKLDRAALAHLAAGAAPLSASADGAADPAAAVPHGRIEILLARLWREVLRLPESLPLGAEDNFFDLGGQSLAMVAVHERLREELPDGHAAELPLVELFEHTTIRSLAARLAALMSGSAAEAPAVPAAELARRAERQRQAPAWKERLRQARRDLDEAPAKPS